jgi:hypothetical protein
MDLAAFDFTPDSSTMDTIFFVLQKAEASTK